jgi:iron complex outermembrane recepter protein
MTLARISARRSLATALAAVFAHAALPAAAQQAEKVEKIEVTGSNIKRVDAEGPAPVQIITRQDIERTGSNTVSEVLRQLPANSAGSYDETFTGSFARGSSGVSLRGLGQKSTLVLINGRRMAVYSFAQNLQDGFVDLNSIPLSAIERIEVLKDGASAIYGSDAIAGVVNVILRKDYTGAEMTVGGGVTSKWDGQEVHVSGAVGFGTPGKDKYNVMLSADYFNREHIWARDRRLLTDADYRDIPGGENFPNSTLSNPGTYLRRPGTAPFGTATRQPFPTCPADRILVFGGTTNCTENTNIYQTAVPETTRAGLFGRATYEFSSSLSAFAELAFNSNETFTQNAPFSVPSTQLGTAVVPGTVNAILPVGNPSNPFSVPIEVRYRFSDVGPRQITNTTDATRIILGLNGGFGAWSWETAAGYTESKSEQRDRNNIRISGLRAVIADGSYNFLNNAANTQATYDRLRVDYSRMGDSKLSFVDAKISGELMQMANGPLGMAAGLEFRREDYRDVSDPVLTLGDVLGRGSTTAIGKRDITSGYVEFSVPVLKAVELQLAARTDRYSDFGSSSTPKVGIRWTPSRELLLRATYAKGFRAPSIPESGESNSFFFQTLEDTRKCAINTVYCGGVSTPGTLTANPDLQPEKSDSWTVGFVFEPSQNMSLGLDWYNIKQKQIVSNRDLQEILNNETLYARFITRGPPTSDDIARGAPGPLVLVAAPFENLAQLETSGIDIDARVRVDSGIGRVTLGLTGSYLHSYKQPLTPEDPPTELAGTYNLPRFKGIGSVTLDSGPWSGTVTVNYIRGFKQSTSAGANAAKEIKAWTTLDLQGSYAGLRNTKFVLGVKNAADKEPPIAIAEQFLYTFQQHSLRGLFAYASVNYKFR